MDTIDQILPKINNRSLKSRLTKEHLETYNSITKEQCGFRKNYFTINILITLQKDICKVKNQKQQLTLKSLDIEKAYYMVWQNSDSIIIHNSGINGNIFQFLQTFLKNSKSKSELRLSKIH